MSINEIVFPAAAVATNSLLLATPVEAIVLVKNFSKAFMYVEYVTGASSSINIQLLPSFPQLVGNPTPVRKFFQSSEKDGSNIVLAKPCIYNADGLYCVEVPIATMQDEIKILATAVGGNSGILNIWFVPELYVTQNANFVEELTQ